MSRLEITEEMDHQKDWYLEAKKQTLKTLPEFLNKLANDYNHDYGTIVHAITAAAIAAAHALNDSEQGGITGFQAGHVMWKFIRNWQLEEGYLKLIRYNHMLYPQYEDKFQKTIRKDIFDNLKIQASALLAKTDKDHLKIQASALLTKTDKDHMCISVRNHWESIAQGIVPFGYKIVEDEA